jgi:hypothetical protein
VGLERSGRPKGKIPPGGCIRFTQPLICIAVIPPTTSDAGKNPQREAAQAEQKINFEGEQMVMQIFCDNAKTYVQLSGAALAFHAIIFSSNSSHSQDGIHCGSLHGHDVDLLSRRRGGRRFLSVPGSEVPGGEIDRLTGIFTEGAAWAEAGTVWDMLGAFYGGAIRAGQAMISLTQLSDRGGTDAYFLRRSFADPPELQNPLTND